MTNDAELKFSVLDISVCEPNMRIPPQQFTPVVMGNVRNIRFRINNNKSDVAQQILSDSAQCKVLGFNIVYFYISHNGGEGVWSVVM
jgi:hypothetical protein